MARSTGESGRMGGLRHADAAKCDHLIPARDHKSKHVQHFIANTQEIQAQGRQKA